MATTYATGPVAADATAAGTASDLPRPFLDWSGKDKVRHWGGGKQRPCRLCKGLSLLVDDAGLPCHKVCAENELARHLDTQITRLTGRTEP